MEKLNQTSNNGDLKVKIDAVSQDHLMCVLVLDTSTSMGGESIESLNGAVNSLKNNRYMDKLTKKCVDVAIVEFNDNARLIQKFIPLQYLEPINLKANGITMMGDGINMAFDLIEERTGLYSKLGTPCSKILIYMITDGMPSDDVSQARQRIIDEEAKSPYNKLKFYAIGVPGYDEETLLYLTKRSIKLNEALFEEIFEWISKSVTIFSQSRVGENPQLPDLPKSAQVIPPSW